MPAITRSYVNALPDIYRDVLRMIPRFNSQRRLGAGVAIQSIYAALENRYPLSQVRLACEKMTEAGVFTIRNEIFVYPTESGEQLIRSVADSEFAEDVIPEFPELPV